MNLFLTLTREMELDVVKHKQQDPGAQPPQANSPAPAAQVTQQAQGSAAEGTAPTHHTPASGGRYTRDADGNLVAVEE